MTIAQAIDESGWGQSQLATQDNNLFGIKGAGPAGSDSKPTQEYENGQWVTINAGFRVYDNVAQSIDDHGALLATSGYYTRAMADRNNPDAFANALTGVYATNPELRQRPHPAHAAVQPVPLRRIGQRQVPPQTHQGPDGHASAPAKATAKPDKPTQPSLPGLMPTASASPAPHPRPHARASPSPAPAPTATTYPTPAPTPTGDRRVHADARTEQNRRTAANLHPVRGGSFHTSAYSHANPVHTSRRPHQRLLPRRPGPHPRRRAQHQLRLPRRPGPHPRRRAQDRRPVPRRLGPDPPRLRQHQPRGFRGWERLRRRPQRHSHARSRTQQPRTSGTSRARATRTRGAARVADGRRRVGGGFGNRHGRP